MPLDSIAVLSPLDRATDANGNPVPGAKLRFYEAGTSSPKAVFSDSALTQSLGSVVTCDAGGYPTSDGSTQVSIYVGSDAYKLVVTTSADVTVHTRDNLKGAPEIPDVASTALPNTPVVSKTSTYTILSTDQGKLIQADPTGGSFALTLPSAITVGDNFRVGVRHNGASTSNVVGVRATGGQTVGAPGQASATSISLVGYGQTIWLVSNGADWVIDGTAEPLMMGGLPFFKITDRLTAPPVSPVGGNRYIVNGTPTGVWLTLGFAEDDIAEADGNGSWLKYSPAAGFFAYVADEDLFSKFDGTSWEDQTGMGAADSSTLKTAVYEHQVTQNNGGGTNTNGSWATRPLTTEVVDSIGMSVSSNEITVPVGTYLVVAQQQLFHQAGTLGSTGIAQQRLTAVTATFDALSLGMPTRNGGVASGSGITFDSYHTHALHDIYLLNVTVAGTVKLEYKTNFQTSTNGLGYPANNGTEVYARVAFLSLTSLQGATGAQGIQGNDGLDAAIPMQWSTATSGDPGSGKVRGNNATIASITELGISETDAAGGSLGNVLTGWSVSTSSAKGTIKLTKEGAPQNFHLFRITAAGTDLGSYRTFAVTYVSTSGTISNGNDLAMLFVEKGDAGDPGTTVPSPSGLTAHTDFDDEADFVITVDTSAAGATKKSLGKNLGYTAPVTGSARRSLQSKLAESVSLKDFPGAAGDGSSAVAAFNLAIAYANANPGTTIYVPDGEYLIDSALDPITASNSSFVGSGDNCVINISVDGIAFSWGQNSGGGITGGGLSNCRLVYPSNPGTSAVCFLLRNIARAAFSKLDVSNIRSLARLGTNVSYPVAVTWFDDITGYVYNGGSPVFDLKYGAGFFGTDLQLYVGGISAPSHPSAHSVAAGTDLINVGDGGSASWSTIHVSNSLCELFYRPVYAIAGNGKTINDLFFDTCIFDYAGLTSFLLYADTGGTVAAGNFVNCWATGWAGVGYSFTGPGTNALHTVTGGRAFFCGSHGIELAATARDIAISTKQIYAVNRAGGTAYGILIPTGATRISIDGVQVTDQTAIGLPYVPTYGIAIGNCTNIQVNNSLFEGASGTYSIGTLTSSPASGNVGYPDIFGDAEISALSGLTSAASKAPYFTGSGTAALADFVPSATTFSPTVSAASGTITTSVVNRARYWRVGNLITAFYDITISNAGTGSGALRVTLPVAAASGNVGSAHGEENTAVGYATVGIVNDSIGVAIIKYDGGTPVVSTHRHLFTAIYEAA